MNIDEARSHIEWRINRGDFAHIGFRTERPGDTLGEHEHRALLTVALSREPFGDVVARALLDAAPDGRRAVIAIVSTEYEVTFVLVALAESGGTYDLTLLHRDSEHGPQTVSSEVPIGLIVALLS